MARKNKKGGKNPGSVASQPEDTQKTESNNKNVIHCQENELSVNGHGDINSEIGTSEELKQEVEQNENETCTKTLHNEHSKPHNPNLTNHN